MFKTISRFGVQQPSAALLFAGKSGRGLPHSMALLLLLCACSMVVHADDNWPAFPVEWRAGVQSPADLSFLLKPANDRISIKDGHLVRADGTRFRIWGINATGKAALPATNNAPVIAAALARHGINCVRFHFLDKVGALIAPDRDDTRTLNPDALRRLDRFVFELKQRGIYSDLNLNVYRTYKPGDGVRECAQLGIGKGATYFDERLLELQRKYARQLLTHTNAFTVRPYTDEPAVAIVEFVNENSLVEAWLNGNLAGTQTNKAIGTWHDIPPSYAAVLTDKYNAWLARQCDAETLGRWRRATTPSTNSQNTVLGATIVAPKTVIPETVARLRKKEFDKADRERFATEAAFYMQIEHDYFRDMAKYLRDELGVKALLIGNSDHGHSRSFYPQVASLAQLDVIDGHIYWQHPSYTTDAKGKRTGFWITNTPMVDDPLHSTVVQLSRTPVAGKPYTVSEANHPFPSEYASEGVPILAAYAALQDWDGIFWYTLGHKDVVAWTNPTLGHFDFAPDPVKMSQIAAGALVFLRGDVRVAQKTATRTYTRQQIIDSLRLPRAESPYYTPGFPLALPLIHAVRVASFDGPPTGQFEPIPSDEIVSDTGELVWRKSLVTVDTPRSQALVGHLSGLGFQPKEPGAPSSSNHGQDARATRTRNLLTEIQTKFATVTLGALDDKPIAGAARLLLTVGARVATTGMVWNDKRTTLEKWGNAPTRIEPVTGKITLTGLEQPRAIVAQALDGNAQSLGKPVALTRTTNGWSLDLGQPATPWYVVLVTR
jgi:hypothetical protein